MRRWWELRFEPDGGGDWPERVREQLRTSARRWTLSDVPYAVSLSGGLDSSALVGLLAEGGARLSTYSLGFGAGDDELPVARALAERWGTDHHELVVDADDLLDDLLAMVWALDEPYGGGLPSWYVFRFMARGREGRASPGRAATSSSATTGASSRSRRGRLARAAAAAGAALPLRAVVLLHRRREAGAARSTPSARGHGRPAPGDLGRERRTRRRATACSTSTCARSSPDEFLPMTDRFSMAHSLEARTPFLDHELVELVASIPPELRTSAADPKGLLRAAVADLLTPAHLEAPKRGFTLPLAAWLRGPLRPLAERLLADEHLARQGLFRPGLADAPPAPAPGGRERRERAPLAAC